MTRLLILDVSRPILRGQQVADEVDEMCICLASLAMPFVDCALQCASLLPHLQSLLLIMKCKSSTPQWNDPQCNVANVCQELTWERLQVTLHAHASQETGHMSSLVSLLDAKTFEITKHKPRCLLQGQSAIVEVTLSRTVCLETYKDYRALGRIALRDGGRTIAVGTVTEVVNVSI